MRGLLPDMKNTLKIVALLETGRSFDRLLLRGIGQYSRLHGPWAIHVVSERLDQLRPPASLWDAAGIIGRLTRHVAKVVTSANVPAVVVDSIHDLSDLPDQHRVAHVSVDFEGVVRLAAEYFLSRGFEHVAFVGEFDRDWSHLRRDGIQTASMGIGQSLRIYPSIAARKLIWTQERPRLADWLAQVPKPVGVIARDDVRALQVLEACRIARIHVPSEMAVLGVGDDELSCMIADPPLSSVKLNAANGGYQAAHALHHLVQRSKQVPRHLIIEPDSVVVRSSTDIDISQDPDISAARNIIHRRSPQNLSVDAVAETIGVPRRTLEAKFRKHTNRTILDEIRRAKLQRAKSILSETKLPLDQVANLSGYGSASYLNDRFAKELGLTPAQYRLASRAGADSKACGR